MMLPSLFGLTLDDLTAFLALHGHKGYRAQQIMDWLWKKRVSSFDEMLNLPPDLRRLLADSFSMRRLSLVEVHGEPQSTQKFLSRLHDGHLVESVIIPAARDEEGNQAQRLTLCVSSQVGCAFGCKFCASGLLGLVRNLTAAEIMGQIVLAEEIAERRVDNLVFMGMGEPLSNVENLLMALDIIMSSWALNIGARHITVSTSGVVHGIERLARYGKPIRLAISLHGATDEVRNQIMPINQKWPLRELIPALHLWMQNNKHMITLEYILIQGVNDALAEAQNLASIAQSLHAKVNVIPYNTVDSLSWVRPPEIHCRAFCQVLIKAKIPVTMRYEKGHDINAACGQLRLKKLKL